MSELKNIRRFAAINWITPIDTLCVGRLYLCCVKCSLVFFNRFFFIFLDFFACAKYEKKIFLLSLKEWKTCSNRKGAVNDKKQNRVINSGLMNVNFMTF